MRDGLSENRRTASSGEGMVDWSDSIGVRMPNVTSVSSGLPISDIYLHAVSCNEINLLRCFLVLEAGNLFRGTHLSGLTLYN